ncbi:hypothetical protein CONLIGDRAFT_162383 [Coniochaeta ligniaria NRRL 30616]|uniref:Uncharacterized protein n=1 Tax=Coniochaeta ligniaria NRRL 30616 TaxID=1408157 RepID=A0A1J7J125_9PEZI|nr:hypothetical protein CONLIGDRAFT_162383 [Coniochaeta ligniaria NRRL 30616]
MRLAEAEARMKAAEVEARATLQEEKRLRLILEEEKRFKLIIMDAYNREVGDGREPEEKTPLPAASSPEISVDVESSSEGNAHTSDNTKPESLPDAPLPVPKIESSYRSEFQPYLKFVSFPDLDVIRGHQCAEPIRDIFGQEGLVIIKWLRMVKGVRKVMKLKVLDSRHEPHKEEVIEECIRNLQVEELDWRRTDLSIETVKDASPGVQRLHLYSSGDWAPLLHWVSADGLNRLEVGGFFTSCCT